MMALLMMLFSLPAWAGEWLPVWELQFSGKPKAAFFSAHSGEILVSVAKGKSSSELRRISFEGKDLGALRKEEGSAGPLRGHGDRLYWAVGKRVISLNHEGGGVREVARLTAEAEDLALDSKAKLRVATSGKVEGAKENEAVALEANGLFQLLDKLYLLKDGKIFQDGRTDPVSACAGCRGLERGSDGSWITVQGSKVVRPGKGLLLAGKGRIGRIGYFFRRESREDLLLVPFPDESVLRAYRAP